MVNDVHPYQITTLKVLNIHARKNFEIPIAGSEGLRHLVILGRNGAGKTTLLRGLQEWCSTIWAPELVIPIFSDPSKNWHLKDKNFLFAYFPANRKFSAEPVAGPTKTPLVIETMGQPGPLMMQHMVNQRFEELLAKDEGKAQEAERIYQWFGRVEKTFQKLTNISTMKLSFERSNGSYAYGLLLPDGRRIELNQLPDGWSSVLAIASELMIFLRKCYLCERPVEQGSYEIEHIHPKNENAWPEHRSQWRNLAIAHDKCNKRRILKESRVPWLVPGGWEREAGVSERLIQRPRKSRKISLATASPFIQCCALYSTHA